MSMHRIRSAEGQAGLLEIGQVDVELPFGFAPRADRIMRAAMAELARLPVTARLRVDLKLRRLRVPPLRLGSGETDFMLARRIARAIADSIIDPQQPARAPHRPDGANGADHAD